MRAWGAEFNAPDKGIYEQSNGRKWDSTDKGLSGLYGVEVDAPIEVDDPATNRYNDIDRSLFRSDTLDPIHTDGLTATGQPFPGSPFFNNNNAEPGLMIPGYAQPSVPVYRDNPP
jgi:hypothetical protein